MKERASAYRKESASEAWRARADARAGWCCACGLELGAGRRYLCAGCQEASALEAAAIETATVGLRRARLAKEAAFPPRSDFF